MTRPWSEIKRKSEPEYLWNWARTRRHIKGEDRIEDRIDPLTNATRSSEGWSLCGQVHRTKSGTLKRINDAQRAKMGTVPVCQHCEREWAKLHPDNKVDTPEEFAAKMREFQSGDPAADHANGDMLMADTLVTLGYTEGVHEWLQMTKWYE